MLSSMTDLNSLKPAGNYMFQLHFVFIGFARFLLQTAITFLNNLKKLIFE
jgi:hypothetical protein